mgnify:CR=1 FL=1
MDECKNGQKNFLKIRVNLGEHPVENVGKSNRYEESGAQSKISHPT